MLNTLALTVTLLKTAPDAKVVTVGSASTYGLFNEDEQVGPDETGEMVSLTERTVFIAAGSLTVADGTTLKVRPVGAPTSADVTFTVRGRPRPRENGDLWAISVTRVL